MAKANTIVKVFIALAALAAGGAAPLGGAAAQSLKEIRARENEERALDREVAYTEQVCGSSITASIDWRSAVNWPEGRSLAASCDGALGALESICRSKDGKNRGRKVSRFVCGGDGAGPSLRGGTLRFGASPNGNGFAATKSLLDSKL